MIRSAAARIAGKPSRPRPTVATVPSASTTSTLATWSTVVPYRGVRAPDELFAIMPPSVARELVATSGPKVNPCGFRYALSWSRTTPAPTRTVRASRFRSLICRVYRAKSTTSPSPTAPPASPVPAPRGVTDNPAAAAARSSVEASPAFRGNATPAGRIW